MNIQEKYNKALCSRYPFLKKETNNKENEYNSTHLDDMPDGWRKAFGLEMCESLLDILTKGSFINEYKIVSIKEKFGRLRWYGGPVPYQISLEYNQWRLKYELKSAYTCISCGAPAELLAIRIIRPFCRKCVQHIPEEDRTFYTVDIHSIYDKKDS